MKILNYISSKKERQVCLLGGLPSPRPRPFTHTRSSITVDDRGTRDARCQSLCTPNASFLAVPI